MRPLLQSEKHQIIQISKYNLHLYRQYQKGFTSSEIFYYCQHCFLFFLRDALKAICLLIIPSDLDGFLIKFSINCDLNKVPKLSNYCIYKSTANGGHFWMHARHPIAMMICLEKWKTYVSQTNCILSMTMSSEHDHLIIS